MSHYSVVVFCENGGKDLEELLAPYDENLSVPHYVTKEEIIERVRNNIEEYRKEFYEEYLKNPQKYLEEHSDEHGKYISEEFPKKLSWSDEDCYKDGVRYYLEENIQPNGSVFTTYNPNARWDYYAIGGRFDCGIPLKDSDYKWADEASMDEVDIDYIDEDKYKESLRFWQLYVDGQTPVTDEDKDLVSFVIQDRQYFIDNYDNAQEYAGWMSRFTFYAAVLPTGEWLECGKVGWFGTTTATAADNKAWRKKVREILRQAQKNNWYITMIDCHI